MCEVAYRVVLMGSFGVGKTLFVYRLTNYICSKQLQPHIGIDEFAATTRSSTFEILLVKKDSVPLPMFISEMPAVEFLDSQSIPTLHLSISTD
jgi:GTPase SAR1 family protein